VKPRANLKAGVSNDTSHARSITWLQTPVRLLPNDGPLVVGVARNGPMSKAMLRHWRRVAEQRGAGAGANGVTAMRANPGGAFGFRVGDHDRVGVSFYPIHANRATD
jgi:hypothetical protein